MSAPLKIIFMGTPAFAIPSLTAIHTSRHPVAAIYTQPPRPAGRGQKTRPSPVHLFAQEHHINIHTPLTFKEEEPLAALQSYQADIAVIVAYGMLLPKTVLEIFPHGCVNVHPSLLPRWRGAAPIQRTILAGDTKTAVMIMQMDEGLDTGDILASVPYTIPNGTTSGQLHDTLSEIATKPLLATLDAIAAGTASRTQQSAQGVTYAKKIGKDEAHIDWTKPVRDIDRLIRGLNPFPGAYCMINGQNVKIWEADIQQTSHTHLAGTIMHDAFRIACADGYIAPTIMQWPGKKRMLTEEALRGHPIKGREIVN